MKISITSIFLFCGLLLCSVLYGQQTMPVSYRFIDTFDIETTDTAGIFLKHIDSAETKPFLGNLSQTLRKKGFLSASVDTFYTSDSAFHIELFLGQKYTISKISFLNKDKSFLEQNGLPISHYEKRGVSLSAIESMKKQILSTLANSGYPFAAIYMDSTIIHGSEIQSNLSIQKNSLITYDTLRILGTAQISPYYLQKILKIEKGDFYNQINVARIPSSILSFDFLKLHKDPYVEFINDKATIVLPLDKQKASRFDFIIGVLPRNNNGVRNFTITGDITGQFSNELGKGETFGIRYQRLRTETQDLELNLNYPYIFKLPFGVDGQFSLFRNTDNFLNLQANMGIEYQLSSREKIKFGWGYESSRLIAIDTSRLLARKRLPDQLDVSITTGNISFSVDRLNYRINPSSGWNSTLRLNIGQKTINPNLTIISLQEDNFSFENAYDTLQLSTFQGEINFQGNLYIPISEWGTVKISNRTAYKYNQNRIFENEFYRIGGNKLLRGFNEQTIFTPIYTVFTGELRIILDQFSYLSFPFIDYGYMQVTTLDNRQVWDQAYGIGIGLNFGTPAGIFNISFAAGSRLNTGLNFGETKIHFGYVNLF
jgi:outer membrane protein assembly factor BamA